MLESDYLSFAPPMTNHVPLVHVLILSSSTFSRIKHETISWGFCEHQMSHNVKNYIHYVILHNKASQKVSGHFFLVHNLVRRDLQRSRQFIQLVGHSLGWSLRSSFMSFRTACSHMGQSVSDQVACPLSGVLLTVRSVDGMCVPHSLGGFVCSHDCSQFKDQQHYSHIFQASLFHIFYFPFY